MEKNIYQSCISKTPNETLRNGRQTEESGCNDGTQGNEQKNTVSESYQVIKEKKKQWAYSIQGPLLLPGGCYNPTYSQWNDSYWLGSVFNHAQSIIPVPLVNLDVHHSIKLKGSLLTKKPKSSECIFIYLGMCLTQQKEQQLCKTMPWGRLNSSTQNSAAPVDHLCIGITDTAQNVISSKFSLENKLLQIGWKILLK